MYKHPLYPVAPPLAVPAPLEDDASLALERARLDQQLLAMRAADDVAVVASAAAATAAAAAQATTPTLTPPPPLLPDTTHLAMQDPHQYLPAVSPPIAHHPADTFILEDDMVLQCDDIHNVSRLIDGSHGHQTSPLPPLNEWFSGVLSLTGSGSFVISHADMMGERLTLSAKDIMFYSNLATHDGVAVALKNDMEARGESPGSAYSGSPGRHYNVITASRGDPHGHALASLVFLRFRSIASTTTLLSFTRSRKEKQLDTPQDWGDNTFEVSAVEAVSVPHRIPAFDRHDRALHDISAATLNSPQSRQRSASPCSVGLITSPACRTLPSPCVPMQQQCQPCCIPERSNGIRTPCKPLSNAMQAYYSRQVAHSHAGPYHGVPPPPRGDRGNRHRYDDLASYEKYQGGGGGGGGGGGEEKRRRRKSSANGRSRRSAQPYQPALY